MQPIVLLFACLITGISAQYEFVHETVKSVLLDSDIVFHFQHPVGRFLRNQCRELCEAAKEHIPIIYMDSENITRAHLFEIEYLSGVKKVEIAINCHSLPVIYIYGGNSKDQLKIISLQSTAEHYEFQEETVKSLALARKRHYSEEFYDNNHLATLSLDDRRHLCVAVQKRIPSIRLMDNYVIKTQVYTMISGEEERMIIAIPCPSEPQVFIRLGESQNQVKVIFNQDLPFLPSARKSDDYKIPTFDIEIVKLVKSPKSSNEEEPLPKNYLSTLSKSKCWNLCAAALSRIKFTNIKVKFGDLASAYEFVHPNTHDNHTEKFIVIRCQVLPPISVYLRLGDTENEIKIIFVQSELEELEINESSSS